MGIAATWGGFSVLMVGALVGTGVRGIGQSFLVSNKFSATDPALGQGVPCLTGALGMSSSGGGLDSLFWVMVDGHGTSLNFLVAFCCWYGFWSRPCHWCLGADSGYGG